MATAHEAYDVTWRLVREENTGKMLNLFTTREQTEYPPAQTQTPEGAHFDTITPKDVAEASSSGVAKDRIPKPDLEGKGEKSVAIKGDYRR